MAEHFRPARTGLVARIDARGIFEPPTLQLSILYQMTRVIPFHAATAIPHIHVVTPP